MNTEKIKNAFDKASYGYDQHSHLQFKLGCQLIEKIKSIWGSADNVSNRHDPSILDLGCGTGKITNELASYFIREKIIAVDIAPNMLNIAKRQVAHKNVQFYLSNFDEYFDEQKNHLPFDLIFSNMALHWSRDLNLLINKASSLLNKQGMLAFTIPMINTFQELQSDFAVQHFYSPDEIKMLLTQNDLNMIHADTALHHLTFSNTLNTLQSIKKMGANYVSMRKTKGLRTQKSINQLNIQMLTYHIGYFVARLKS